jgi:molybdopterin-guanine dinucleotide biosynthesis protein A
MGSIEGFILTGGESRRMGTDKSQLTFEGQTFLERIAAQITAHDIPLTVVGKAPPEFHAVSDIKPNWGALGGLHTALANCSSEWAMVLACDYPFVTGALLGELIVRRDDFDAVAPIQRDGRPQPLCTLYRVTPCLKLAEKLIESGERKPIALLQSVRTRWISFDELANLEGADRFFENVNSPDDYNRIVEKGG